MGYGCFQNCTRIIKQRETSNSGYITISEKSNGRIIE